ncbi:hypothetical protein [Absidia glauca]|uniref:RxLR effector protein n=1 Tax=Absidia glauca TaxID=4829 RepID=A0A163JDG0_ABSGL|nr:hypothetical protein [Absidia glauca]
MVMKLTLLSIVLAASLVTALPREYSDVKKVAKFDQRSLKNVHGDFNAIHIKRMTKRGPDNLGKAIGDVVNAALNQQAVAGAENGADDGGEAAESVGEAAGSVGAAAEGQASGAGELKP